MKSLSFVRKSLFLFLFFLGFSFFLFAAQIPDEKETSEGFDNYYFIEMESQVDPVNLEMLRTNLEGKGIELVDSTDFILVLKSTERELRNFLDSSANLIVLVYKLPLPDNQDQVFSFYGAEAKQIIFKWSSIARREERQKIQNRDIPTTEEIFGKKMDPREEFEESRSNKERELFVTQKESVRRREGDIQKEMFEQEEERKKISTLVSQFNTELSSIENSLKNTQIEDKEKEFFITQKKSDKRKIRDIRNKMFGQEEERKKISNLIALFNTELNSIENSLKKPLIDEKEKAILERQREIIKNRIFFLDEKVNTLEKQIEELETISQKNLTEEPEFRVETYGEHFEERRDLPPLQQNPRRVSDEIDFTRKPLQNINVQAERKIKGTVEGSFEAYDEHFQERRDLPSSKQEPRRDSEEIDFTHKSFQNLNIQAEGKIKGTVEDLFGNGIQNINIIVYDSSYNRVGLDFSDSSGSFEVTGLSSGDYKIHFFPKERNFSPEWNNNKYNFGDADFIQVVAGKKPSDVHVQLADGGSITGTVTAAVSASLINSIGIQNVRVSVYNTDPCSSGGQVGSAYTDSSGNYTIQGLSTGTYKVYFDANYRRLNYLSEWYNDKSTFETANDVSVTAGSITSGIDGVLNEGGSLSGTITGPSSSVQANASGIRNVRVEVYDASQSGSSYVSYSTTDSSGNYTVQGLPTGSYRVYFDSAYWGGINYLPEWYNDKASFDSADDVAVTAGSTTSGLDAVLAEGSTISGTVTGASSSSLEASGTGIQSVQVYVYDLDYNYIGYDSTDSSGIYQIVGLPTGSYRIRFYTSSSFNYLTEWYNDKDSFDTADNVSATAGSTTSGIDAVLTEGGIISGTVTGASASSVQASGSGIQSVRVKVYEASSSGNSYFSSTSTDSSGNYSLKKLPAGTYKVFFDSNYYSGVNYLSKWYNDKSSFNTADDVSITLGNTISGVNAVLTEGGIISGTITGTSSSSLETQSTGIENIYADAYDLDNNYVTYGRTDSSGNYQIVGLPSGSYKVHFSSSSSVNYLSEWYNDKASSVTADEVAVTTGSTTSGVDALLTEGGIISGTVTGASSSSLLAQGSGIEDVRAYVYDQNNSWVKYVWTDCNGFYEVKGLPAGSYRVYFNASSAGNYLSEWYNDKTSFDTADDVSVTAGSTTTGVDAVLTEGGIISGTVTGASSSLQANGSGIQSVEVDVFDQDYNFIGYGYTDSSGNYQIVGLPTGSYRVRFYSSSSSNYLSEWYNDKSSFDTADDVAVTAGSTTSGIDAVLAEGGIISGTVTGALSSSLQANGSGIQSVRVKVYDASSSGSSYISYVNTDSAGNYTLNQLPAGTYRVYFDSAYYSGINYLPEWYNDKSSFATADNVAVTQGSTTSGIDAQLAVGGIISGTVTGTSSSLQASGTGIQNVSVRAYNQDYNSMAYGSTDSSGNYQLVGLPTGSYRVRFYSSSSSNYLSEWYNDKSSFDTADDVAVTAGSTASGIDAVLAMGGIISGTITGASSSSLEASGTGVQSVYVDVYDQDYNSMAYGYTDSSGNYQVVGLPTGSYRVQFYPDSSVNYLSEWYNDKSSFVTADDVAVTQGSTTSGIDAQLAVGGIISGIVTGTSSSSLQASGTGIQNVSVRAYNQDYNSMAYGSTDSSGNYQLVGLPTGSYRVRFYSSSSSNYLSEWYNDKSSFDTANDVAVTAGSTTSGIDAVLAEGGIISGTVTGASSSSLQANGSGIQSVRVYAYDASSSGNSSSRSVYTDSSGNYTLNQLPAGTYRVYFDSAYYSGINYLSEWYNDKSSFATADNVAVTQGSTTSGIDAQLAVGGIISGTVTGTSSSLQASGTGIQNVSVRAYNQDYNSMAYGYTDSSGNYQVVGLPTGSYRVQFYPDSSVNYVSEWYNDKSSFATADDVAVTAGSTTSGIDAVLAEGGIISGTVTGASSSLQANGSGIQSVEVDVFDQDYNYITYGYTDSSGNYQVVGLPTGSYRVQFYSSSSSNYLSEWYNDKSSFATADNVVVTQGSTTSGIDAQLAEEGIISGTVTGASSSLQAIGSGIQYVRVYAYDASSSGNSSSRSVYTDSSGNYTLNQLLPGTYRVYFNTYNYGGINYIPEWYNDKSSFNTADDISVTEGNTTSGVDVELAEGGIISGTVTGSSSSAIKTLGSGIQSVQVSAYDLDNNYVVNAGTDSSGNYQIAGLPTGSYKVRFSPSSSVNYLSEWYNDKTSFDTADDVSVTAASTTSGVDAVLAEGGIISGTVTGASSSLQASGTGVQSVRVRAYDLDYNYIDYDYTDSSGNYQIVGLPAGSYRIRFYPSSSVNYISEWYNDKSSFATADDVAVAAGSTTSGIDAVLTEGGIISGTVTGASSSSLEASGAGVQSVSVDVYDLDYNYITDGNTDSSGNYQIVALPTGSYRVEFYPSSSVNYFSEWYNDKSSFATADDVAVTAGSTTSGIDAVLTEGGIISGTVTGASSSSLEASGAGVQSVRVKAYDASSSGSSYYRSVSTDSSGNYTLNQLPSGTYRVFFDSTYYSGINYVSEWYNDKSSFATADDVAVTAGSMTSGIDAVLAEGGIISGTVTGASSSSLQANGSGIQSVYVDVYDQDYNYITYGYTDSSGNYQLVGLPTGSYRVRFYTSSSVNYLSEWYNDKSSFDTADDVAVTAGSTTSGIDAVLAEGGIISGTVTGASSSSLQADGSGIQYVRVKAYDANSSGTSYYNSVYTDSAGNYSLNKLPTGTYKVYFDTYYYGGGLNYVPEWNNDKSSFKTADDVSVTEGSTTSDIDAVLAEGGIISGTVTGASSSSLQANGSGINSVDVNVYDLDYNYITDAYTDSTGSFQVVGLPTSSYKVVFYPPSSVNYVAEWHEDKSNFYESTTVAVSAGSTTSNIDAQLSLGGIMKGTVTGSVLASASTPIPIADVDILLFDRYGNYIDAYGWTDSTGTYTVQGIPAGSYKVFFDNYYNNYYSDRASELASRFYGSTYKFSKATVVSITPGTTTSNIDVQLEEGGKIKGEVTSSSSGVSLQGIALESAYVRASDPDGFFWTRTYSKPDGTYTLIGLPTADLIIYFSAAGYHAQYYNGKSSMTTADYVSSVVGTTVSGIDAVLGKSATISGKVTDASNKGIYQVVVGFSDEKGNIVLASGYTNWLGEYTSTVPAGTWHVIFNGKYTEDNYASEWYNDKAKLGLADAVTVLPEQNLVGINATLVPGGGIKGRVTGQMPISTTVSDQPTGVDSVEVQIRDEDNNIFVTTTTANGGYYTLKGIPEGTYKVYFKPDLHLLEFFSGTWYDYKYSFESADSVSVTVGNITPEIDILLLPSTKPKITLSTNKLNFGSTTTGNTTPSQIFRISVSGEAFVDWTVSSNKTWLSCLPGNGTGSAIISVSVNPAGLATGQYTGTVTVSSPIGSPSSQTMAVNLNVKDEDDAEPPFGSFDTPLDGTSGITGAVPVTGWVLDDIGVESVKIYRDPVDGEATEDLIYIGDAGFVEGARPDVEDPYSDYPKNDRAGWGYMMLTNFLPNQGNGTYVLHAIVKDKDGHQVSLGTKTITCGNSDAVKPFGTIDTPIQGGTVSGLTWNAGWALTPQPCKIPEDGSTILVWVDGVRQDGHPSYNQYRNDIATLFPGFANTDGAVGAYLLDTSLWTNGVHTIAWSVTDDCGRSDGIGSRFFTIFNTGTTQEKASQTMNFGRYDTAAFMEEIPISFEAVRVIKGYSEYAEPEAVNPDPYGRVEIEIREVERMEFELGSGILVGYTQIEDQLRPLPIGSTLDKEKGIFYWQPGPGFIGEYDLVFIREDEYGIQRRIQVKVNIRPKFGMNGIRLFQNTKAKGGNGIGCLNKN